MRDPSTFGQFHAGQGPECGASRTVQMERQAGREGHSWKCPFPGCESEGVEPSMKKLRIARNNHFRTSHADKSAREILDAHLCKGQQARRGSMAARRGA
eukprot:13701226-Alexandrium_andersonii.AAC.1